MLFMFVTYLCYLFNYYLFNYFLFIWLFTYTYTLRRTHLGEHVAAAVLEGRLGALQWHCLQGFDLEQRVAPASSSELGTPPQ